jgi:hypothetical protein
MVKNVDSVNNAGELSIINGASSELIIFSVNEAKIANS